MGVKWQTNAAVGMVIFRWAKTGGPEDGLTPQVRKVKDRLRRA